jgi:putative ABC transport system permease protein
MWAEGEEGMKQQSFALMFVGDDYLKTMGMTLLAGENFPFGKDFKRDSKFIANEAAVKLMGWDSDLSNGPHEAIGKKVKFYHQEEFGQIVGVVKDFNFTSLHNPVEPLLILRADADGGFLHLKISGQNLPETMDFIREKWAQFDPNHPFEYSSLIKNSTNNTRRMKLNISYSPGFPGFVFLFPSWGCLGFQPSAQINERKRSEYEKFMEPMCRRLLSFFLKIFFTS